MLMRAAWRTLSSMRRFIHLPAAQLIWNEASGDSAASDEYNVCKVSVFESLSVETDYTHYAPVWWSCGKVFCLRRSDGALCLDVQEIMTGNYKEREQV